jgi:drug/metabolite transporter (DMT)-like permease
MSSSPQFKAYSALLAVYIFWGTTYLTIRMALESFPPFLLIAIRFLTSGAILLVVTKFAGGTFPRGRELLYTALFGIVMIGGGNGSLIYAETWVPSGFAALFVTTSPFWLVGLEALFPGGDRFHAPTLIGIVIGFIGLLILVAPTANGASVTAGLIPGFLVLQVGVFLWCLGSVLQRRLPTKAHPVVSGAIQQMATGLFALPFALLIEEHPVVWTERGVLALVWLITFGSIVGYSAYIYAMENLPVTILSTYSYVNPVVAVFLGWLFYREPFGTREIIAMVSVFIGVGLVKYFSYKGPVAPKTSVS